MIIAVTSTGPTLEDAVETRFGRCAYFLIIDTDSMAFEVIGNPNVAAGGGAGIQSAQLMADKDVEIVLTGNCGPNAFQTFGAAGIQVISGVTGQVRQVVEQHKAGGFAAASGPNVQSHFGMGGGGGSMGGGRGMGVQNAPPPNAPAIEPSVASSDKQPETENVRALKEQVKALQQKLVDLSGKIEEMEGD
ncbi:MAG: NifB/NifX family molybdenum-iron cluster-binding protein [Candidatus Lernaella stagnicola]|nr:NifB/NifX family molybdenum-iron cluster-binding protein [Candidatus Lernaella stagnicola]